MINRVPKSVGKIVEPWTIPSARVPNNSIEVVSPIESSFRAARLIKPIEAPSWRFLLAINAYRRGATDTRFAQTRDRSRTEVRLFAKCRRHVGQMAVSRTQRRTDATAGVLSVCIVLFCSAKETRKTDQGGQTDERTDGALEEGLIPVFPRFSVIHPVRPPNKLARRLLLTQDTGISRNAHPKASRVLSCFRSRELLTTVSRGNESPSRSLRRNFPVCEENRREICLSDNLVRIFRRTSDIIHLVVDGATDLRIKRSARPVAPRYGESRKILARKRTLCKYFRSCHGERGFERNVVFLNGVLYVFTRHGTTRCALKRIELPTESFPEGREIVENRESNRSACSSLSLEPEMST